MGVGEFREFIELASCLNFTDAAGRIGITQPALSKHIAALEKEFGAALFVRDRRGLELTEEGKVVLAAATSIVGAYDDAVRVIGHLGKARPIRVDGTLYDDVVSGILSLATILFDREDCPRIVATRHEGRSYASLLANDEVDVILSYLTQEELDDFDFAAQPLAHIQFVAIVEQDSPLASHASLSIDDLRDETFIQLIDQYACPGWKRIEEVCRAHGFEPRRRPVVGSPMDYASIAPNGAVYIQQRNLRQNRFLENMGRLRCIPVTDEDAHFTTDCIYRRADAERLAGFLATLEEARGIIAQHGKGAGGI